MYTTVEHQTLCVAICSYFGPWSIECPNFVLKGMPSKLSESGNVNSAFEVRLGDTAGMIPCKRAGARETSSLESNVTPIINSCTVELGKIQKRMAASISFSKGHGLDALSGCKSHLASMSL